MLFRKNNSAQTKLRALLNEPDKTPAVTGPVPASMVETLFSKLLDNSIQQNTTLLGRLSTLAILYEPTAKEYRHPVFSKLLPHGRLNGMIRAAHLQAFADWLKLSRSSQHTDLVCFLGREACENEDMVHDFIDKGALDALAPADAEMHERHLFASNLQAALQLNSRSFECVPSR